MRIATKHIYLSFRFFFFALTGKIAVINLHSYLVCTVHCQTKHWVFVFFFVVANTLPYLFSHEYLYFHSNSVENEKFFAVTILFDASTPWYCSCFDHCYLTGCVSVHVAVAWLYNATFFMYSLCEQLKTGKHMMLALPSLHLYLQFISFLHGVCGFGGECTIQL